MLVFDKWTDFSICFFAVLCHFAFRIDAKMCFVVGEETYDYVLDISLICFLEHEHKRKFILF